MHREYPKKPKEDLRIPVTFPLSGDRLKAFRAKYIPLFVEKHGREPTEKEIRFKASEIALNAIDEYCKS